MIFSIKNHTSLYLYYYHKKLRKIHPIKQRLRSLPDYASRVKNVCINNLNALSIYLYEIYYSKINNRVVSNF